ncbi:MAG: radical SAM protein, partial [Actinomycetes bacterium]
MAETYWITTLGCPKNQVDSDKIEGTLLADGMVAATGPDDADLVVVNTCAFVEEAREESVATILALDDARRDGSRLVVSGCMAERYGTELADALPEVDEIAGFSVPVSLTTRRQLPVFDLLNLPRPASTAPWAYVKIAEGCDKACGFCAIPTFRGPQRSRTVDAVLAEVDGLGVREVVLVAQDLAAYGRDQGVGERSLVPLYRQVQERVDRVRLLYLYPSEMTDELVELVAASPVPYFDLSLQHTSAPLLRRMRRWGDGTKFLERIESIRSFRPDAAFRSNFIVGYP